MESAGTQRVRVRSSFPWGDLERVQGGTRGRYLALVELVVHVAHLPR